MDEHNVVNTPNQKSTSLSRIIILLFFAFIIVIISSVITTYYLSSQLAQQSEPIQNILIPTIKPTSTVSIDETASWKTYANNKYGFEFKYPQNWPLLKTKLLAKNEVEGLYFSSKIDSKSADNTIAVIEAFKDNQIKSLEDYKRVYLYDYGKSGSFFANLQETSINGLTALSYTRIAGMPQLPIAEYVIVNGDYYYNIRLLDSLETKKNKQENFKIFNQILSTFKFTN